MFTDSVSKVLSIFEKLVVRLEKIKVLREQQIEKDKEEIKKLVSKVGSAREEISKADKGIEEMKKFLV